MQNSTYTTFSIQVLYIIFAAAFILYSTHSDNLVGLISSLLQHRERVHPAGLKVLEDTFDVIGHHSKFVCIMNCHVRNFPSGIWICPL